MSIVEIEAAGFEILPGILDIFLKAILNPSSEKHRKILALIPKQYFDEGGKPFEREYENILTVVQFVASMTDNFAVDTYRLLKGISLPSY